MAIAVVGCGDWGRNIARTLKNLGNLRVLSDHLSSSKAQSCSQELDLPLLPFESILKDPLVQGIVIATPPLSHFSLAEQALKAGKHVFVEKPLAPSLKEAKMLHHLAEELHRVLMVGHLLRYHPAFELLLSWVQEGKLGTILHINTSRKNFGKIYPDDSVILDLAPHDLSMILPLMGQKVAKVLATSANYAVPLHADESLISLCFENDPQRAFITLSRLSPFKEQKVTVVGTGGMAVFDDTKPWEQKLIFFDNHVVQRAPDHFELSHDREGMPASLNPVEPLRVEMEHFLHCIQTGDLPRTSAHSACEIISIIEKIQLSLQNNSWEIF